MPCKDIACIPRTARRSRPSPPLSCSRQHTLQSLFPGWQPAIHLVLMQPVEDVAAEAQPRSIRVVLVHHLLPHAHWKIKGRLLTPRDLVHLKRRIARGVKNSSTEK